MDEHLVIAATFPSELDAELARATLAAAGIEAFLKFDDVGHMLGSFQHVNGVKLLVDAARLEEAREVLTDRAEELPPEP
jgi:hypothetical protein